MRLCFCLTILVGSSCLVACGGDGGLDSTTRSVEVTPAAEISPSRLKTQFIERADRVCSELDHNIGPALDALNAVGDVPDLYEGFLQQLQTFPVPQDRPVKNVFAAGFAIVSAYEEIEGAVVDHDPAEAAKAKAKVVRTKARFAAVTRAYGFQICGQGAAFAKRSLAAGKFP